MKKIIGFFVGSLLALNAQAGIVTYSDTMDITSSGQSQTWNVSSVEENAGGGTLYLFGEGDVDSSSEFLDVYVETGNLYTTLLDSASGSDVDYYNYQSNAGYTWAEWNHTITLDAATLTSILSDNTFSLTLDLSSVVDTYWSDDFVSWELSYESTSVPEPTSLALLGLGLAGIGFSRKKKIA